jgi:hypothetical protein
VHIGGVVSAVTVSRAGALVTLPDELEMTQL